MRNRPWRPFGFTLIELMVATAVVGILGTVAVPSYLQYRIRAELAQDLLDVDNIRTVLAVESATGRRGLHLGAQPGVVPPALQGQLSTPVFVGEQSLRSQLLLVPADTFNAGSLRQYALLVDSRADEGLLRLRLFENEVR